MSLWYIVWLLAAAAPQGSGDVERPATVSHVAQTSEVSKTSEVFGSSPGTLRSGRELSDAVQAALRRWVRPTDAVADQAAREFLVLYNELGQDRGLGPAVRESLRVKVRGRLARLADQISKRVARERREAKPEPRPTLSVPPGKDHLAQIGGFGGGLAGAGIGGPAAAGTGAAAWGGLPADNGEQLVDLIRRTIAPSTWDVNGGPGTIYYWRPGRALVIRQTSEVHEDVADLLQQLERMSR
jgi:hypothetical protein